MVTVGSTTPTREFVEAVSRLVTQIGEQPVATLLSPSRRVTIAMEAVRDARDEVYYRTKWEFRRAFMEVELVANQMWYELPTDYEEMASGVSLNRKEHTLPYLDYKNLMLQVPELRTFPPGSGVGDLVTAGKALAQTDNYGEPHAYTTLNGYIGLYLIPDATFVALEGTLFATYWKQAPSLISDNDDIGLPRHLWSPANLLALALLKKNIDKEWQGDKADGLAQLARQADGRGESEDTDVYHTSGINYNE